MVREPGAEEAGLVSCNGGTLFSRFILRPGKHTVVQTFDGIKNIVQGNSARRHGQHEATFGAAFGGHQPRLAQVLKNLLQVAGGGMPWRSPITRT